MWLSGRVPASSADHALPKRVVRSGCANFINPLGGTFGHKDRPRSVGYEGVCDGQDEVAVRGACPLLHRDFLGHSIQVGRKTPRCPACGLGTRHCSLFPRKGMMGSGGMMPERSCQLVRTASVRWVTVSFTNSNPDLTCGGADNTHRGV